MYRTVALAVVASVLVAAPAKAGEVIVVDGDHAVRVNDPDVPTKAEIALPPPTAAGARVPLARSAATGSAARAGRSARAARRVAAQASRTRRAWRRARGSKPKREREDRRAVYRALARAERRNSIAATSNRRWRAWYVRSVRTYKRLKGARREQLGYVIDSVEALALAKRLGPSRMPAAFVQLERNRRYWRSLPYPGAGDQVSFKGSEVLYQYFPGEGLQLHPLSTFKKANHMHGDCEKGLPTCDVEGLRRLLDEMAELGVRRLGRFTAWEYSFHFGGGAPPWISGMADATGIQAYARAAQLLGDPRYVEIGRQALGAFETPPPNGVRTKGFAGGVHYLQYSFAPTLFIFNAFIQSLIGLYDFGEITGDPRATQLYLEAEPEARAEIPRSDLGDWSLYNYRGHRSSASYHELLRELLASMCSRRLGEIYCEYADRYERYQRRPPT